MTTSNEIEKLIKIRDNGDDSVQPKIDLLFEKYREETKKERDLKDKKDMEANVFIESMFY